MIYFVLQMWRLTATSLGSGRRDGVRDAGPLVSQTSLGL